MKAGEIRKPRDLANGEGIEPPFDIPASWRWCRLDTVGAIIGGGTPSAGDPENFAGPGDGVPWLTPADLGGYRDLSIERGSRDLTEKGLVSSSATMMPAGTVLFTSRAPIGYVAIAANPISTNQGSERIVGYLNERGVAINVMFFQVFDHGDAQLLSRAWLIDPGEVQVQAASAGRKVEKEPWNGEFYVSFGADETRRWDEAVKHGFISGGGGTWYSNSLRMLGEGDRVWVKIPGKGFVGVGRVAGPRVPASEFRIDGQPALDVLQGGYHRHLVDDPERCEYFVPIDWQQTVPEAQAVQEVGMFGNQNTVCKPVTPSWRTTVERLKERFGVG